MNWFNTLANTLTESSTTSIHHSPSPLPTSSKYSGVLNAMIAYAASNGDVIVQPSFDAYEFLRPHIKTEFMSVDNTPLVVISDSAMVILKMSRHKFTQC